MSTRKVTSKSPTKTRAKAKRAPAVAAASAANFACPPRLYHGTAGRYLDRILAEGLLPRSKLPVVDGAVEQGNWEHTVPSNPAVVYVTNAYPLHFCAASLRSEDAHGLIVEIDSAQLDAELLRPDEDFLEQIMRGRDDLPAEWSLTQRNVYYRDRMADYDPLQSLRLLGTMAYAGPIPPAAITRILLVKAKTIGRLIRLGFDPMIALANYRFMGAFYRSGTRWMFGDVERIDDLREDLQATLSRDGIEVATPDQLRGSAR